MTFQNSDGISKHIRETHRKKAEERLYECYICKIQIRNHEHALRNHMKMHSDPPTVQCGVCMEDYSENESHLCGEETTIQCDYCEKQFTTTDGLVKHLNDNHEQKKLHRCETCIKYLPMLFLKKHHNCRGQLTKPYACSVCIKRFATLNQLRQHEKTHRDDKTGKKML